jgi:two-component system, OmpR family, sensor kinase
MQRLVDDMLGLPLARGLITRLGGTIEAGSAPEGGAAVTIRPPPAPAGWSA